MKPEILLIHPKVGSLDKLGISLPLNCLSIASVLNERSYRIKIIDQRTEKDWKKILLESLKNNPICAGITCMTGPQVGYALEISKFIKKNSEIPVVWGGIHPTLLPEQTLKNENIDIIVKGEGEETFYELVKNLEKEKSLENVKGVWYKETNGKIKKNPERPFIDLNELPNLPYHLINLGDYSAPNFSSENVSSLSFESSRGCPFKCGFCYNVPFHKCKWRSFSSEKVIERLDILLEKGIIKSIYFVDDNICGNFKHFEKIVEGIIKERIDLSWGAQGIRINSLNRMDNKFLKKIERSGCKELDIGIESLNPRILRLINKNQTTRDIEKILEKIGKTSIVFKYNFLVGLPTQNINEVRQDVTAALEINRQNRNSYVILNVYTPLPKTPLFDLSVKYGFKPPEDLEGWSKITTPNWILNFPSWLSKKEAEFISNLSFLFTFSNKNIKTRIRNPWIDALFNFYQPFAKIRLKYNFNEFLVEKKIVEILEC
jgi:radical SAM superfamily enzyme YgiQ (UPF0313 family)